MRERTHASGIFVLLAAAVLVGPAGAGCGLPMAPSKVPNGTIATDIEMRSAMQILKQFDRDVTVYLKCLDFEFNQGRLSLEERARLHNVALDKLDAATKKFNEQMKVYLAG